MSTNEWAILITAITGAAVGLLGVVFKFVLDFYKLKMQVSSMSADVKKIDTTMDRVEKQTNSMTAHMVKAAREQGMLEGADEERKDEELREAKKGSEQDPIHVKVQPPKKLE